MKHLSKEVSFKINQLLYDKGWRYELGVDETGHKVKNSLAEQRWNKGDLTYADITITEVIDWLYEKHGIWISTDWMSRTKPYNSGFHSYLRGTKKPINQDNFIPINNTKNPGYEVFNSSTEAYEAAIEYTLNELI